ncbi:MAG: tripartite tricarboxylate transporter TctB family protein [Brachybacterium sp.]|uniref:tripartite tricarboxylate transporter TctB family protein n=1 Tax=Brachybacterium sp. TaxID=1891286 RepID=UPI002649B96F|nr:tripartite tricarboxylate transporter TctB family protein [Brachybacterium sp.]MDN5688193.1 tripartite tricarboxylate transporter TctB family protein [Brachybacterium sp.]
MNDRIPSTTPTPDAADRSWLRGRKELVMVALLAALGALLLIGSLTMNVLGDSFPGPQFVPVIVGVLVLLAAAALLVDVLRNPEAPHDDEDVQFRGDFSADMLHDISGLPDPGSPGAPTAVTGAVRTADVKAALEESDRAGSADASASTGTGTEDGSAEATEAAEAKNPASDLRTLGLVLAALIVFVAILPYVGWVLSAAALFWCVSRLLGSRRPIFDIGVSLLASSLIQLIFGGLLGLSLPALFGGIL